MHTRVHETVATYTYWYWRPLVNYVNRSKDAAGKTPSLNCAGRCLDCRAADTSRVEPGLSTAEVARLFGVAPNTLRIAICKNGHYQGIRPFKRPNRLLSWPVAEVYAALGMTPGKADE